MGIPDALLERIGSFADGYTGYEDRDGDDIRIRGTLRKGIEKTVSDLETLIRFYPDRTAYVEGATKVIGVLKGFLPEIGTGEGISTDDVLPIVKTDLAMMADMHMMAAGARRFLECVDGCNNKTMNFDDILRCAEQLIASFRERESLLA